MSSVFCDSGLKFGEIILKNKIGGRQAVRNYLKLRIKMLRRHYGDMSARNLDTSLIEEALAVFSLGEALLDGYDEKKETGRP